MDHLKLTADVLSVDAITDSVVDATSAAVSIFVATRDNLDRKTAVHLHYEEYEKMALKAMKGICEEIRKKWPAIHSIAIHNRLGSIPAREASVVIAVSSPRRNDSMLAVASVMDKLRARVPVWKRELPTWKENKECPKPTENQNTEENDRNLVLINVSTEEMNQRIHNFIQRKRDLVNINNIYDFIPGKKATDDDEGCARVRAQFIKRKDSKGHLKIRKVVNEWGPQTVHPPPPPKAEVAGVPPAAAADAALPPAVSERIVTLERRVHIQPVGKDIYSRIKHIEDRLEYLQSLSPEYSNFWGGSAEVKQVRGMDYIFSADDIARKIEELQKKEQTNIVPSGSQVNKKSSPVGSGQVGRRRAKNQRRPTRGVH